MLTILLRLFRSQQFTHCRSSFSFSIGWFCKVDEHIWHLCHCSCLSLQLHYQDYAELWNIPLPWWYVSSTSGMVQVYNCQAQVLVLVSLWDVLRSQTSRKTPKRNNTLLFLLRLQKSNTAATLTLLFRIWIGPHSSDWKPHLTLDLSLTCKKSCYPPHSFSPCCHIIHIVNSVKLYQAQPLSSAYPPKQLNG